MLFVAYSLEKTQQSAYKSQGGRGSAILHQNLSNVSFLETRIEFMSLAVLMIILFIYLDEELV
jgi:hypothetical protein